jgi:hypothetical protein
MRKKPFKHSYRRCGMKRLFQILALVVLLAPSMVYSQAGQTGSITGIVRTPEGEPLSGVIVLLKGPALVIPEIEAVSNERGIYRFSYLSPGVYELTFLVQGLEKAVQGEIVVSAGKTVTMDTNLRLRAAKEAVVVEAKAPTIDRLKTVGVTTLNKEFLTTVPAERELNIYFNMAPGVTGNVAHGSSTRENAYTLDGVNLGDPATGTQLVEFGLDVMEEVSVQSGGLPAEYGSVKGAVVNVITKSGGNSFGGSASFYYNHERLQSDNTEGVGVEGTSGKHYQYEPAITFGGPIIRDRIWFFTNLSFRQSAEYENGYPADDPDHPIPIKEFQPYPYVKFTFQPNQANKFVASYNFSDRRLDHRFAAWDVTESATVIQTSPTHVFNLQWTRQFGPTLIMNMKFGVVRSVLTFEGKDHNQAYRGDGLTNIWSGSYFRAIDENIRNRYQVNADATAFIDDFYGSHEIKIGGELQFGRTGWNVTFTEDPLTGVAAMIDYPEWAEQYGIYNVGYHFADFERKDGFNNLALFLNDSWSVVKRLALNLGFRFEYNATIWPPQMQEEGPQEFMGLTYNRSITKTIKASEWINLAPRFGLIFDLFNNGSTFLKASWGRYIQPNITEWVNLGHPNGWFYYNQRYDWQGHPFGSPFNIRLPGGQNIGYPGYNDGKLKAPYVDEFTVGLERELFEEWSVGLRYIRKWDRNLIEDVDANQLDIDALLNDGELVWTNWEPVTAIDPYNGQEVMFYNWINPSLPLDLYTINPPGADRDYDGLEFTLRKRYRNGWQFHFSYVYQKSRGLIPTADSTPGQEVNGILGTSDLYENPNAHTNAIGRFPRERRHMLKVHGMVRGPWGINLSGYLSVMSGRRYTRMISTADLGISLHDEEVIFADPLGSQGYDPITNLDVRAEKQFNFGRFALKAFCDVFNVFNASTVTAVRTISGRTEYEFRDPLEIVPPRIFQLGTRIEF